MSVEGDFKNGMSLLMSGRCDEASAIFLKLYGQNISKSFKIQLIDALLASLDTLNESEKLISLVSEGVTIAEQVNDLSAKAYFLSRKADFLMHKKSLLEYRRVNLKLTPGWFCFSLEEEKKKYEAISQEVDKLEKEISFLLAEAVELAENQGDKKCLALILMSKASIESSRYLQYKADLIMKNGRAKLFNFFHKIGYEIPILYGLGNFKVLKNCKINFSKSYLKAAKLFEEIDDMESASAYYDLAVHLSTAYDFRKAKRYLDIAEKLAKKYGYMLVIEKIKGFRVIVKNRNKDVPNYLEGERRNRVVIPNNSIDL